MPISILNLAHSEVGIQFANFSLFLQKCRIQAEVGICTEVGKPNADYEQSEVDIRFTDFPPILYDHKNFEVGISLPDFSLPFSPMPSSLLKLASGEVDVWFVDFLLHSPKTPNSS